MAYFWISSAFTFLVFTGANWRNFVHSKTSSNRHFAGLFGIFTRATHLLSRPKKHSFIIHTFSCLDVKARLLSQIPQVSWHAARIYVRSLKVESLFECKKLTFPLNDDYCHILNLAAGKTQYQPFRSEKTKEQVDIFFK